MRRFIPACAVLLLTSTLMAAPPPGANPIDKRIGRGGVGLKAGVSNESRYRIDGQPYELKTALGTGVFFDISMSRHAAVTITTDLYDVQLFGTRQWLLNVAIGLKPTLKYNDRQKLAWRAYGTVGFADLAQIGHLEATTYLTLKGAVELLLFHNKNIGYVFELGVLGSPRGGNKDFDVTWGPVWTLRVGVMY